MIKNLADLLGDFVKAEVDILNEQNIKHPPTIGAMYEGLTKEIFNKSIFEGLDLRVITNSFIIGCKTEFDVMLVTGEGEEIPYTKSYKYKPENIIAIVQTKKNIFTQDLREGHDNIKFLIDYYKSLEGEDYHLRLLNDGFRHICRKPLAARDLKELSLEEEYIYESLRIDAILPVRIIWGYNGFKSELKLRESFIEHISENLTNDFNNPIGYFGPHNFANLTICNSFSIIKNNGMPFIVPKQNDNYWPFLATSSHNPLSFFLELIWTRLSYKFKLPMEIFGDDLDMEPAKRFLDGRVRKIGEKIGWEFNYFYLSNDVLKKHNTIEQWQPTELDETQFIIINELCVKSEIDIVDNKDLEKFVKTGNYKSLNEFVEKLKETALVTTINNKLTLLTDKCSCVILPDGRYIAGENKSGRLMNWVKANNFMK